MEKIKDKYVYVVLILIIIAVAYQFSIQRDLIDETSAVVLNLHKRNLSYELENEGENKVNVTIYSENLVTGSVVLEPSSTVEIKGDDFEISYNWRYLLEGLKNFNSEELIFSVNGDTKPTLIKSAVDSSYFYLLMPIKN